MKGTSAEVRIGKARQWPKAADLVATTNKGKTTSPPSDINSEEDSGKDEQNRIDALRTARPKGRNGLAGGGKSWGGGLAFRKTDGQRWTVGSIAVENLRIFIVRGVQTVTSRLDAVIYKEKVKLNFRFFWESEGLCA